VNVNESDSTCHKYKNYKGKKTSKVCMTKVNYSKTCLNLNPNIKHMIIKDKNIKCAKQKFKHNFILIAYENIK